MEKTLGIDLGTNSIGMTLRENDFFNGMGFILSKKVLEKENPENFPMQLKELNTALQEDCIMPDDIENGKP